MLDDICLYFYKKNFLSPHKEELKYYTHKIIKNDFQG